MSRDKDADARAIIEKARAATSVLRDATRNGTVIEFRQRDPLIVTIHDAIDLAERTLAKHRKAGEDKLLRQVIEALSEQRDHFKRVTKANGDFNSGYEQAISDAVVLVDRFLGETDA